MLSNPVFVSIGGFLLLLLWEIAVAIAHERGKLEFISDKTVAAGIAIPVWLYIDFIAMNTISPQQRWFALIVCVIGGAIAGFLFWFLGLRTTSEQKVVAYVYAHLLIEPSKDETAIAKVIIENGDSPVSNVRVTTRHPGFMQFDSDLLITRMLAPRGKISSLISPLPLKRGQYNNITVTAYYDTAINGSIRHFIATFRFLLQSYDIKSQNEIYPETPHYEEGTYDKSGERTQLMENFAGPEGTMALTLAERAPNGEWNVVQLGNGKRGFLFDPEARRVSFETVASSGRIISQFQAFGDGLPDDRLSHFVLLRWGPDSGDLWVDGVGAANNTNSAEPTQPSPTPGKEASPR
ncbi:MAG TPA: hypothetical protein VGM65_14820 [Candidatus Udaeobacter sp.]|jgi:hypothetical protein